MANPDQPASPCVAASLEAGRLRFVVIAVRTRAAILAITPILAIALGRKLAAVVIPTIPTVVGAPIVTPAFAASFGTIVAPTFATLTRSLMALTLRAAIASRATRATLVVATTAWTPEQNRLRFCRFGGLFCDLRGFCRGRSLRSGSLFGRGSGRLTLMTRFARLIGIVYAIVIAFFDDCGFGRAEPAWAARKAAASSAETLSAR